MVVVIITTSISAVDEKIINVTTFRSLKYFGVLFLVCFRLQGQRLKSRVKLSHVQTSPILAPLFSTTRRPMIQTPGNELQTGFWLIDIPFVCKACHFS